MTSKNTYSDQAYASMQKWRKKNSKKYKAYQKAYHANWQRENMDIVAQHNKVWYAAHKEKMSAYQKKYRKTHQKQCAENKHKYYLANKEKIMAYNASWRKAKQLKQQRAARGK